MAPRHGFASRKSDDAKYIFYSRHKQMMTRCFNKNSKDWKNYGGRGITVSKEWLDFMNFKDDMYISFLNHFSLHGKKNTTLDRIDVNQDYCKKNCQWATKKQQGINVRNAVRVWFQGKLCSVSEICQMTGRSLTTIYSRIQKGKPLTDPYRKSRHK